jgi:hypothetical protein
MTSNVFELSTAPSLAKDMGSNEALDVRDGGTLP